METHCVSQRLACRVVGISRSVYRYQPDKERDNLVIAALQAAVERYPAYGFSKLFTKYFADKAMPGTTSVFIACTAC